jgi:uncharacterized membrane protein YphA (DoxX/SURF4 family)
MTASKSKTIISWLLRILAALIMVQSLFFKFSAADESVYIFSTLGMEPWGRIGTGVMELCASVLLLIPRTAWLGALIGIGTMSGAIFFHLTSLGIEVNDDGGQLFIYAILTFVSCAIVLLLERERLKKIITVISSR